MTMIPFSLTRRERRLLEALVVQTANLAASQRRVKKGLATRKRTVLLMLDEVILTEPPVV